MSLKTKVGGISHSIAIAHFSSLGYTVSFPLFDDAPYDLIVDDGDSLHRVQCKSAKGKRTTKSKQDLYPRCSLSINGRRAYKSDSFDFLWVLAPHCAYLIPVSNLPKSRKDGALVSLVLSRKYNTFMVDLPFLNHEAPSATFVTTLTDTEKKRIESLFMGGETARTIAVIMGLQEKAVNSFLYRHRIKRDHRVTGAIKEQIRTLYLNEDKRIGDIALQIGFSRAAVSQAIKELGISKRRPKITPQQKPIIIQMAREGKSVSEIAKALGIDRTNTISTFLHRQKWLVNEQPTVTS